MKPAETIDAQRARIWLKMSRTREALERWVNGIGTQTEVQQMTRLLTKELTNPPIIDPVYTIRPSWVDTLAEWRHGAVLIEAELVRMIEDPDSRENRAKTLIRFLREWEKGLHKDG